MICQLAGLFYYDKREIQASDRALICGALRSAAGERFQSPGLFMVQSGRAVGPRSEQRRYSPYVAMMDGLVHNTDDLARRFCLSRVSDRELAAAVFENLGHAGLRELIGDWSLAIFDEVTSTITLASDFAGVRPIYYHETGNRVFWSSSLTTLVEGIGAEHATEIDESYVASFLTTGNGQHRTPYSGIFAVPPGTAVTFSNNEVRRREFWTPSGEVLDGLRPAEYEERLQVLFEQAVSARLQTAAPVTAELSGGLDSSSVTLMSHRLIASNSVPSGRLIPLTYKDETSGDEPYISAVEQRCGLRSVKLELESFPAVSSSVLGKGMPALWEPRMRRIGALMAENGSDVLVTGQLGDLVMGNWLDDSEQAADYVACGDPKRAVQEAFAWSQSLRTPVYPILWSTFRNGLIAGGSGSSEGLHREDRSPYSGDSLTSGLRRQLVHQRENDIPDYIREALPSRRKRLSALRTVLSGRTLQCPESLSGISWTHPFSHLPLLEFMMSVPASLVCRPGVPRRLMRRAFSTLLPDEVLRRGSKGSYSSSYQRSLRPLAQDLLRPDNRLQLVEHGFLERRSFVARLNALVAGQPCNESQLRYAILLECWLRGREQRAHSFVHPDILDTAALSTISV